MRGKCFSPALLIVSLLALGASAAAAMDGYCNSGIPAKAGVDSRAKERSPGPACTPVPEILRTGARIFLESVPLTIQRIDLQAPDLQLLDRRNIDFPPARRRLLDVAYCELKAGTEKLKPRYQVAGDSEHADLVFTVRFIDSPQFAQAWMQLDISDAQTQAQLWRFRERIDPATLRKHREEAFSRSIKLLLNDFQALVLPHDKPPFQMKSRKRRFYEEIPCSDCLKACEPSDKETSGPGSAGASFTRAH